MTSRHIRALALDDDPADLETLRRHLGDIPGFSIELSPTADVAWAKDALTRHPFDVCFLAERIGQVAGIEVLCDVRKSGCNVPVILLSTREGTETSIGAIRAGAQECLAKRGLSTRALENALKYVLERQPPALPSRGQPTLEELVANLEAQIGPSLEAARAALACVLAEGYLAQEQREQLGEARDLCRRALGELDEIVSIAKPA